MRSPDLKKLLLAVSLVAGLSSGQAHHSGAMFDMTKTFTVQGTVREFQYTNPHSWLQVLVVSPDGKAVE
jgi:phage-related protein